MTDSKKRIVYLLILVLLGIAIFTISIVSILRGDTEAEDTSSDIQSNNSMTEVSTMPPEISDDESKQASSSEESSNNADESLKNDENSNTSADISTDVESEISVNNNSIAESNGNVSKNESVATPSKDESVGTPSKDESIGTPSKDESIGTPSKDESIGTPSKDESVGTPSKDESVGTPSKDESIGTPSKDESVGTPSKDESVGTPSKDESIGTPSKDESIATPSKDESIGTPSKDESVGTPSKDESIGTPSKDESVGTPSKDESIGTPSKDESIGTPSKDESIGTPSKDESVGTPSKDESVGTTSKDESKAESTVSEDTPFDKPAQITILKPVASGINVKKNSSAIIDYSNTKDGYVMVKFIADVDVKLKVQVKGPTTTYTYNIKKGEWTVFPLSDGNGSYSVKVFKNVYDSKYSTVLSLNGLSVDLDDEYAPFIRPNQYVNYENAVNTMEKASTLLNDRMSMLEKVETVYNYVTKNIKYDYQKAATVQSGYLPDLDLVLKEKKGICFDYASLMTGMLRSQNIPCKLVVGYANTEYHAWISVYSPEMGWVDGVIYFNGVNWQQMDPTFASGGNKDLDKIAYTTKYIY